jgi:hypothetical protein
VNIDRIIKLDSGLTVTDNVILSADATFDTTAAPQKTIKLNLKWTQKQKTYFLKPIGKTVGLMIKT